MRSSILASLALASALLLGAMAGPSLAMSDPVMMLTDPGYDHQVVGSDCATPLASNAIELFTETADLSACDVELKAATGFCLVPLDQDSGSPHLPTPIALRDSCPDPGRSPPG
jgi:hypothetical protein